MANVVTIDVLRKAAKKLQEISYGPIKLSFTSDGEPISFTIVDGDRQDKDAFTGCLYELAQAINEVLTES